MFLSPSQYQAASGAGGKQAKATLEEWLQKSRDQKPDEELVVSSSEEEEKEDEAERAKREELQDAEEEEDTGPSTWSGEEKWPRLNSPPFSNKEEPLILRNDPRVEVPAHLAKYLRKYQLEGVQFLYDKYIKGVGGILGDDMGLGKTVQTTAFLIAVLGKKATAEDICSVADLAERKNKKKPILIVAPASLLLQWRSELLVWSFFHIHVCTGATKLEAVEKAQNGELEVLIASYETYRVLSSDLNNVHNLNKIDWEVVVFDEAHRIKNPQSRLTEVAVCLKTKTRFGLTGTLLQNEMAELHCTMNWAKPGCLGSYKDFKDDYETPIKLGQRQNASLFQVGQARDKAELLKKRIDEYVLRRSKKEIADQVPPKEDWIVMCPLSEKQMAVYDRLISHKDIELLRACEEPCVCGMTDENDVPKTRAKCCFNTIDPSEIELFDVPPGNEMNGEAKWCSYMLPAITQICKICNHLDLVRVCRTDKPAKQEKDERFARIVFDSEDRNEIEQREDLRMMSSVRECGKLQVLQSVLATCYQQRDKVLIFSYSVRMLDILEKFLVTKGHKFLRLDGSTPPSKRLKLVDEFNSSEQHFCMIMSTKAGGLGINLTSANVVVVIDPNWNPSHDMQAQDRAYRIGQRRHVKVYRFLSAGTIEEVMYQRQIYKQQLLRISMDASHERRYYTGVQGDNKHHGELFGVANLFKWKKPDTRTKDILDRESRAANEFHLRELQMERMEVEVDSSGGATSTTTTTTAHTRRLRVSLWRRWWRMGILTCWRRRLRRRRQRSRRCRASSSSSPGSPYQCTGTTMCLGTTRPRLRSTRRRGCGAARGRRTMHGAAPRLRHLRRQGAGARDRQKAAALPPERLRRSGTQRDSAGTAQQLLPARASPTSSS